MVIFTYPANTNENAFAQQVLALVNKERTTRGLNTLVLGDAKLSAATAQRAREIAEVIVKGEREQDWKNASVNKYELRFRDAAEGCAVALAALFNGEPTGYINVYPDSL